ncbi:AI-2E family transporter [Streptomyces sp. ACA25]|uniref:AI-2E family transporter n=1 Tax=Streptomyces sp. ACA25 TaxID=3022596 RepID=UPI00230770E7|nr:AI-2E family transporter [Streptomyces sp. ACA25]MDB1086932.1 AI-2E family transporter [Streptomyces sp. ACA25]
MSRLDRLRTGLARFGSRVSAYREAAEREAERREREAAERVVGPVEPVLPVSPVQLGTAEVASGRAGEPVASGGEGGAGGSGGEPQGSPLPPQGPPRPEPAVAIPWGLRVAAEAGWRLLVLAAAVWVLLQVVEAISLLVIAFAAGLLITALLQPLTGRLKRMGLGRGPATAVTSVGGFAAIGLIGWFVVWQVMESVDDLVDSVTEGINELRDWLLDSPLGVDDDDFNELVDNVNRWLSEHSAELTTAGLEGVNYLVRFFTGAGVALFVVLFLLYDGRNIWYWFLKFFPAPARPGIAGAGPRAWITLTGYVRGTVLVALIDALGIGIGLYILQVPMAVPLAVIVFVSAFVPILGAIVSGALAVVVAFVTEGPLTAVLVLGVVLLVQQVESQILQPFILGRLVRVHPLAVVLAVTGGTLLAGIPGAVVAVPLVAVLNTVVVYLRAYQNEAEMRADPRRSGATIASLAPTAPSVVTGGGPEPGAGRPEEPEHRPGEPPDRKDDPGDHRA